MKKMTAAHVKWVVMLLRTWRHRPLRWNLVQERIAAEFFEGATPWTRQSLQANERIKKAWDEAKKRLSGASASVTSGGDADPSRATELQAELDDLQERYDALIIRHRQLAYNASFLPGGANLLIDPLPDNTPVQNKPKRRKASARKR
ncbi:MAG: hypothetical protein HY020_06905 [Burkholderiales bacterium]|nr:hypothetical protein [Burkholderiales bacterium]